MLSFRVAHFQEAPGPRAVLYVRTKTQERTDAEQHTAHVNKSNGDVAAAFAQMPFVKVRVADGEEALERRYAQDGQSGEGQEGHIESKVGAHLSVRAHAHQGPILSVSHLHDRTDRDGAEQVRHQERSDQDVVQGRTGAPAPHLQQDQRQDVAHDADGEHHRRVDGLPGLYENNVIASGVGVIRHRRLNRRPVDTTTAKRQKANILQPQSAVSSPPSSDSFHY